MDITEERVCERFKEVRVSLKMKQSDFAKEIKLTQGHVSDIENKRKNVSDRIIEIICLKFNVREEWLRYGKGEMHHISEDKLSTYLAQIAKGNDDFIKDIIEVYMEVDESSRQALKEIAKRMIDKHNKRG